VTRLMEGSRLVERLRRLAGEVPTTNGPWLEDSFSTKAVHRDVLVEAADVIEHSCLPAPAPGFKWAIVVDVDSTDAPPMSGYVSRLAYEAMKAEADRLSKFEAWLADRAGPTLSLDAVREILDA
jgi:hypothetical protein